LQKEYSNQHGEEINLNEISKKLNIPKEEIAMALDSTNQIESIYEEKYVDDENGMSKIEMLTNGEDEAEQIANKIAVKELIAKLNDREKSIILLRYFKNKTQTEVSRILGITQVQVSRIEKKILLSMREKIGG
jgi:RNA polymerase sporulation-specific sigma factor